MLMLHVTAVHEAGHPVAACALRIKFERIALNAVSELRTCPRTGRNNPWNGGYLKAKPWSHRAFKELPDGRFDEGPAAPRDDRCYPERAAAMMSDRLIAAALAVVLLLAASPAKAFTTGEMAQFCGPLAERPQPKLAQGTVDIAESSSEGICWGSFTLLQELSSFVEPEGKSSLHLCLPDETTVFQLVQIFTSWAREHPEKHQVSFPFGALTALGAAFPCQVTDPGLKGGGISRRFR